MQMSTRSIAGHSLRCRVSQRPPFLLSALVLGCLSIVGCGGAGGGALPSTTPTPTPIPTATPTPTPIPTATPAGTVVAVAPLSVTVSIGDTQAFTAAVSGAFGISQAVTWSVQEGTGGGTISADGLYTAPANPGTYHIIATSQINRSSAAAATVIVQAGNATGSIQ